MKQVAQQGAASAWDVVRNPASGGVLAAGTSERVRSAERRGRTVFNSLRGGACLVLAATLVMGCHPRRPADPGRLAVVRPPLPDRPGRPPSIHEPVDERTGLPRTPDAATSTVSPRRAAATRLVEDSGTAVSVGLFAQAAELLERAVAVDPSFPRSYVQLARLHLAQGNHALALAFLDKAAELTPGDKRALGEIAGLRGAAFEGLGQAEAARHAYERALDLVPDDPRARAGITRVGGAPGSRE